MLNHKETESNRSEIVFETQIKTLCELADVSMKAEHIHRVQREIEELELEHTESTLLDIVEVPDLELEDETPQKVRKGKRRKMTAKQGRKRDKGSNGGLVLSEGEEDWWF